MGAVMQELIWYFECYGPWVFAGFVVGYVYAVLARTAD